MLICTVSPSGCPGGPSQADLTSAGGRDSKPQPLAPPINPCGPGRTSPTCGWCSARSPARIGTAAQSAGMWQRAARPSACRGMPQTLSAPSMPQCAKVGVTEIDTNQQCLYQEDTYSCIMQDELEHAAQLISASCSPQVRLVCVKCHQVHAGPKQWPQHRTSCCCRRTTRSRRG